MSHNAGTQKHYEKHKSPDSCSSCQNWVEYLKKREREYYNCVSNNPAVYGEEEAEKAKNMLIQLGY